MNEQKLTQLIVLHPEKFVCEGLKKFGEAQGISIFYLNSVEPFSYIAEDLQPQAIIIDSSFIEPLTEELEKIDQRAFPVISLGESDLFSSIAKPLSLRGIFGDISKLLASPLKNN